MMTPRQTARKVCKDGIKTQDPIGAVLAPSMSASGMKSEFAADHLDVENIALLPLLCDEGGDVTALGGRPLALKTII